MGLSCASPVEGRELGCVLTMRSGRCDCLRGPHSGACLSEVPHRMVLPVLNLPKAASIASVSSRGAPGTGATAALFSWISPCLPSEHTHTLLAGGNVGSGSQLIPLACPQPMSWEFLRLGFIRQITVLSAVCMLS